jgi:predicted nucleic acid-binding protein
VAVTGWVLDKSAAVRARHPQLGGQIDELAGSLYLCPVGALEQLYSARSARDYDELKADLSATFETVSPPPDLLDRALQLQQDLAHHHGMWHRVAIPDLLIAEIALHRGLGVVHVDGDYERIAEVRPLRVRRLSESSR